VINVDLEQGSIDSSLAQMSTYPSGDPWAMTHTFAALVEQAAAGLSDVLIELEQDLT
jgi:hypothetical protein